MFYIFLYSWNVKYTILYINHSIYEIKHYMCISSRLRKLEFVIIGQRECPSIDNYSCTPCFRSFLSIMAKFDQLSFLCVNKLLRDIVNAHYPSFSLEQIKRYELLTTEVKDVMTRRLQMEACNIQEGFQSYSAFLDETFGDTECLTSVSEKSENSLQTNETLNSPANDSAFLDESDTESHIVFSDAKVNKETKMEFKKTHYFQVAMEKLEKTDLVFLTGNPGDGKSTVAYHCVKQLSQRAWMVYVLEDLFKIRPQDNLAILIDGPFDQITTSDIVKDMLQRLSFIRSQNDSNKIIVVMQKEVLNYLRHKLHDTEWLPENAFIDFSQIPLSKEPPSKEKSRKNETEDKSLLQKSYSKIPCMDENSQPIETEKNLNIMFKVYKNHFRNMEPMPFLVLSYIAMNGVLNIESFQGGLPDENFLENLSILLGTKCVKTQANSMYELAKAFDGVYLSYEWCYNGYLCVSKCIHDAICSVLYERNPWKFIDMCSIRHLLEISTKNERQEYISIDKLKRVTLRILSEMKEKPSSELFQYLWKSNIWEDETFLKLIGKQFSLSVQNLRDDLQKEFFAFRKTYKNTSLISYLLINIPELVIKLEYILKRANNMCPITIEITMDEHHYGSPEIALCMNKFASSKKYEKLVFWCYCRRLKRSHSEECLSKCFIQNPSSSLVCFKSKPISRCYICRHHVETFELYSEMKREYKDLASHYGKCVSCASRKEIDAFAHYLLNTGLKEENENYILGGVHILGSQGLQWLETTFLNVVHQRGNNIKYILKNIVIRAFLHIHGNKCKISGIWIGKRCSINKREKLDTLVIIHKSAEQIDLPATFMGLSLITRSHREVSPEAKSLLTHELRSHSKVLNISGEVISTLLKSHSNITLISTSSVRSKGYGTALQDVEFTPCIVIYCMIKGVIPDEESHFPSQIGGHPVDVREAFCSFANNTKPLQIGEKIYSDKSMQYGTLGGFVDITSNTKGFITCAHVLCPEEILRNGKHADYFRKQEHYVYDTSKNELRDGYIGSVLRGVIDHNDPNKVSVDAAVVKITTRFPESVEFNDQGRMHRLKQVGFTSTQIPDFSNGEIDSITSSYAREHVIKFGAKSGLTVGFLRMEEAHAMIVKETEISMNYSTNTEDTFRFKLFKQYEVFPSPDENDAFPPFFKRGDSGAFIFMVTSDNPPKLKCIGLGVAVTSHGSCLMTPIENVLNSLELNNESLSKFQYEENNGEESESSTIGLDTFQNLMTSLTETLTQNFTSQINEIRSDLKSNRESVKEIENAMKTTNKALKNIQQQMDKSNQDMEEVKKRVSALETS